MRLVSWPSRRRSEGLPSTIRARLPDAGGRTSVVFKDRHEHGAGISHEAQHSALEPVGLGAEPADDMGNRGARQAVALAGPVEADEQRTGLGLAGLEPNEKRRFGRRRQGHRLPRGDRYVEDRDAVSRQIDIVDVKSRGFRRRRTDSTSGLEGPSWSVHAGPGSLQTVDR